jgi:flagellar hook-basal body complex protein FliE
LAAGKQKDIHQTMIALEKADVAFQLLMQVRNKIIAAYETIMRMQA